MPSTFNDDNEIISIVDSKVQPPSPAIPPPQRSTSSLLSECSIPESVYHPLNHPDISATHSQISDNKETWWYIHGDTFPITLRQLGAERQLLHEMPILQATTSSSTPTPTP